MGEQEGEEESTMLAIALLAERNPRSKVLRRVRTETSFSLEPYVSQIDTVRSTADGQVVNRATESTLG